MTAIIIVALLALAGFLWWLKVEADSLLIGCAAFVVTGAAVFGALRVLS